ncbi:MAG: ATP-binding protein [Chitinophagales bacterium]
MLKIKNHLQSLLFGKRIPIIQQYLLSLLGIFLVSLTCFILSAYIGREIVAFILLITVSVIAMFFEILPVLMSALLSALIWDFFFLPPRFNFRVYNADDWIMLSMYFLVVVINAVLTYKIKQIEKVARSKEEKAKSLKLYDTILNSVSHEFRTPISTIIGATDMLLANPPGLSSDNKLKLLTEISAASFRLNQQVENLLNISRLESGIIKPKREWCDINELINEVTQSLQDQLKDHHLTLIIPQHVPMFKVDRGLMKQVIYNLLNNAGRYTPPESRIQIRVDNPDDSLLINFQDDGFGFSENEKSKVFQKYYQRKNEYAASGVGLGLSIVKGFVEAHDGTIHLASEKERGAHFIIQIPSEKYAN